MVKDAKKLRSAFAKSKKKKGLLPIEWVNFRIFGRDGGV
jgi:hypothetical protein